MYTTQFGGFGKQVFGSRQQLAFINGPCLSISRLGTPFPSIHPFLTLFPCFNPIPIPLSWPFLVPLLTHFLVILLGRLQTSQLSTSKNLSYFPFSGSQLAFLNEWGALWLFDADSNSSRELADNSSFVSGSSKQVFTFDLKAIFCLKQCQVSVLLGQSYQEQ